MEKLLIIIGFGGIVLSILCWIIKEIDTKIKS